MRHHLVCRPVQSFLEAIDILKVGNIAHSRHCCTLFKIFDEVHFMETLFKGIPTPQFSGFDFQDIQALVLARSQSQLDVSLVTQNELRLETRRLNHITLPVTFCFGFERHQVELAQLRGGLQEQAFAQKGTRQNSTRIALLQGRVNCHSRSDICSESCRAYRVS